MTPLVMSRYTEKNIPTARPGSCNKLFNFAFGQETPPYTPASSYHVTEICQYPLLWTEILPNYFSITIQIL